MSDRSMQTEVLIVGGGAGGYAAALAVARNGRKCVVTEITDWLGGQLTAQAVPPDENRWIEYEMGVPAGTSSYLHFRDDVRKYYREHRPLTDAARANTKLNPGNGWVSRLCMEPTIAHRVLQDNLRPFIEKGLVTVLYNCHPVSADVDGDRVRSVTHREASGNLVTIAASYFLDASELGDLLPLTQTAYRIGAEAQSTFGEIHGRPDRDDPFDQQAISWCFAVEHCPGENHTIDKPANYNFWRDYTPPLSPAWPNKLFSWSVVGGERHEPREFAWKPWPQEPDENELEMWRYRRIVDRSIYKPNSPGVPPDVALINMVQMDYFQKPLFDVSPEAQQQAMNESKEQAICFLYWMQTEAPRFDKTDSVGYPGLKLRGDELGTHDGFAKYPYIREARRLDALHIITEGQVGHEQRRAEKQPNQNASPLGMAECFPDSVGVGHYRLDLHPSTGFRNSVYAQACPFRIPLGALIPKKTVNLLAAGKCLGVTHVTNGAYRLHPIEWNIGESAGSLAAYCLNRNTTPHAVRATTTQLRDFQSLLTRAEIPLNWPWEKGEGLS
jgi:hypothetical protein